MITPVDIQQKKFHIGLGYDKKDVNTFFDIVADSYEKLYRSNAELTEKVSRLTDELQNYKSKEADLQRSLLIAEKNSEDTKTKAAREAKSIELEAKSKAKSIVNDAEEQLAQLQNDIDVLETQYAAYKSNFCMLMKKQLEFLNENDFDFKSYIDERALGVLFGATQGFAGGASSGSSDFGSFNGDPQMRDESTLGGGNQGGAYSYGASNMNSTSAVYTSMLSANENFVDPFAKDKGNDSNQYDIKQPKNPTNNSNLKVANDRQKKQNTKVTRTNTDNRTTTTANSAPRQTSSSNTTKTEKTSETKAEPASQYKNFKEEMQSNLNDKFSKLDGDKANKTTVSQEETKSTTDAIREVVREATKVSDVEIISDEETTITGGTYINEQNSQKDIDEDGFEFV